MLENCHKKSHSTLRAKRACLHFEWTKVHKKCHFEDLLNTWSLRSNSVSRQVTFNRTKIGGKCQNWKEKKIKCDILSNFQTLRSSLNRHFKVCLDTLYVIGNLASDYRGHLVIFDLHLDCISHGCISYPKRWFIHMLLSLACNSQVVNDWLNELTV